MKISAPSHPIHLARAYGVQTRPVVQPVQPVTGKAGFTLDRLTRSSDSADLAGDVQAIRPTEAGRAERIDALVGATVPGAIRFTDDGPEPSTSPTDLRTTDAIRAAVEGRASAPSPDPESASIPMYRNPAMKNAAAAGIALSRSTLDISG